MKLTVKQIAQLLSAEVVGDPEAEIFGPAKIEEGKAGTISFLANPKYQSFIYTTQASAVLVSKDFEPQKPLSTTLLKVDDPYRAFTQLLEKAAELLKVVKRGVETPSFVSETAEIGKDVYIGAFVYIGERAKIGDGVQVYPNSYVGDDVVVGENTVIYPNVTLYADTQVGHSCILHAGARVGSDGFGFAPQADGSFRKIPQLGRVVIKDHVEIGANTSIDRATMGVTLIGEGVKLDNLVQIAHNVEVAAHTVIAAQAGVAGSTHIGRFCMIGGQAGIVGHLQIADGVKIDAQSGVNRSLKIPGEAYRGSPVQPHRQQLKSEALFRRLEEMDRKLHHLEKIISEKGS